MKTKLFTLLLVQFMVLTTFAGNVITYTANKKLVETTSSSWSGLHTDAFNVSISSHTFSNGTGTITFSGEVTSIGDRAFEGCSGLTSITIPSSVTSIGDRAFDGCSSLTSITIPNSVTSIGYEAFNGCTGLTSVHIMDLIAWCNIQFANDWSRCNPLYYAHHLFLNGQEVTNLTIPSSVTSIGSSAFSGCSGLTSVTIPESVTSIGYYAFRDCSGLTSITIPNSVTSIGKYAFEDCSGLTSITIPSSVTSIERCAFHYCSGLTSVHITDLTAWCSIKFGYDDNGRSANPLYYAHHLFLNGEEITNLTIPNNVTSIEYDAFRGCSGLTSVTIPNSVTGIGSYAFSGCSGLTSVTLGNGVTGIGWWAFSGCSGLVTVTIPNSVTEIGSYGFKNCSNLTTVSLGSGLTFIAEGFSGCSKLRYITCLAEYPPTVYDAFPSYNAVLKVPCDVMMFYQGDEIWGQFKYIQCIEAEEAVVTTTTVVPAETDATFAWPTSATANTYTLKITKNGVVFCVLTFNANGQLLNIAFAPSRDGAAHAPEAELTATGYQFTVTGLESGLTYAYTLDAKDAGNNVVANYSGTFTTTGGEMGVESVYKYVNTPTKFLRDGQILIQRGNTTYNLHGQVVK